MTDIPITGVNANDHVPGGYAEILFAQGPATAASSTRDVVIVAPMLATGTWTAATLYEAVNESTVEGGCGAGSPAHRAARKFLQINKTSKLYILPVAETVGGSPVAGTFQITFATDPTGNGQATVRVCDEDCTYSFVDADTVTTIAAGIKDIINSKTWLPVTANNALGVLTITAKLKGISQGNGTLDVIQCRTSITPAKGTTVTASGAVGDTVAGAEGSTTEATNLATALATIANQRIYYIVTSANDATSLTALATHINTKSLPVSGLRSVGIMGYTGALAGCQTIATGQNNARLQVAWQEASDHTSGELAAAMAAIRSLHENTDSAYCFTGYRKGSGRNWTINAQPVTSDWPSHADLVDALNDGITPIASDASGSYVVLSATTQSKDSSGTYDDFRATESHRCSVADDWTDVALATWGLQFKALKYEDDELLADGITVNPNQKNKRGVCRPSSIKRMLSKVVDDFGNSDPYRLQDIESTKTAMRVIKPTTNSARAAAEVNLRAIDHMNQLTVRVNEVSV